MPNASQPEDLISSFQTQLEHQWSRFRDIEADDSARGNSYETALRDLLDEYFGGKYDIFSNCSIMDHQLRCFREFGENADNEIDVVALFSQATPRIVLKETHINWVPLQGISFLCDIKSRIDKGRLESDIEKLDITRRLEQDPDDRFGVQASGEYTVDHQLHCLVYDRSSISDDTLNSIVEDNDAWDMILLVEEDTLIVNKTLPIIEYLRMQAVRSQLPHPEDLPDNEFTTSIPGEDENGIVSMGNGLAWFIIALSISIPVPLGINTGGTLAELISRSSTGFAKGAKSSMDGNGTITFDEADTEDTSEN